MSQENVEIVRPSSRRGTRADPDAFVEKSHADVDFRAPLGGWKSQAYRGVRRHQRRFEKLAEASSDCSLSPSEIHRRRRSGAGVVSVRGRGGTAAASSERRWTGNVSTFRRQVLPDAALRDRSRGPRSRGAVGVGDVAGERGDRAAGQAFNRGDLGSSCRASGPRDRSGVRWPLVEAEAIAGLTDSASFMRRLAPDVDDFAIGSRIVLDAGEDRVVCAVFASGRQAEWGPGRTAFWSRLPVPQGRWSRMRLPRPRRSPRSRGAVGVGDVAGERGGRAALDGPNARPASARVADFWDPDGDYYPVRKFPESRPCHGPDEVQRFMAEYGAAWETSRVGRQGRASRR